MYIPQSTTAWACICLLLGGLTIFSVWNIRSDAASSVPDAQVEGIVQLGMRGERVTSENTLFDSESVVMYDTETESIVFEQNGFERRSIASITKLMVAMVALDHGIAWDDETTIYPNEYTIGGTLRLHEGETVTMRDLLAASLIGSANNATIAYVRNLGIPHEEFIRSMNRKAISLGLEQTEFADVTGLSSDNISTAYEVALMTHEAFSNYPEIREILSKKEYSLIIGGSEREHTIKHTNKLVSDKEVPSSGSKTGFIYASGYCLVMQGVNESKRFISVVLGSDTEEGQYADTQRLFSLF